MRLTTHQSPLYLINGLFTSEIINSFDQLDLQYLVHFNYYNVKAIYENRERISTYYICNASFLFIQTIHARGVPRKPSGTIFPPPVMNSAPPPNFLVAEQLEMLLL